MKYKTIISSILGGVAIAGVAVPSAVSATTSQVAKIKVSTEETLSLVLDETEVNFTAGEDALGVSPIRVIGDTNSAAGYSISFKTVNDYNYLKHTLDSVTDKIPSITGTIERAADFPTLGWGYSLGSSFEEIPTESKTIFKTEKNGRQQNLFTVAVRAAESLVAGDYENELIFTILANKIPADLNSITYMQEMTPDICAGAQVGDTKQLIDIRDGKRYWIEKMPSNRCWMTQNLDFDAEVGTPLTTDTTDVKENTTIAYKDYNDGGDYYLIDGITKTSTAGLAVDDTQWHYQVGNYYTFYGATLLDHSRKNASDFEESEIIEGSICPKGWRLPISVYSPPRDDIEMDPLDGLAAYKTKQYYYRGEIRNDYYSVYVTSGVAQWTAAAVLYQNGNTTFNPYDSMTNLYSVRCIAY